MIKTTARKRIFIGMMGLPFRDETVTTLFRLVDAALAADHVVDVWCCGGATQLSSSTLGLLKPRDITSFGRDLAERRHPTTAALIGELGLTYTQTLSWYVCRHCAEEHGAGEPIHPARLRPSLQFTPLFNRADVAMIIGTK
jgi:hypothetical protein